MFYVAYVVGCEPNVELAIDEEGETLHFSTSKEAREWARDNCPNDWTVVEF